MAVVTSKASAIAHQSLAFVGLDRYLPVVVGFDETTRHKPDPEPVNVALSRLGVAANHAAFVGDSPHDIHAGNAAGVVTVAALWGPFSRETLAAARPDHFIECLPDLPAVLEQAFSQTAEHYSSMGELYQSSVNEFSITFEASADSEARRLIDGGQDARATTEHAARIAVALVRLDPRDASTVSCLSFARDAATRTLAGDGKLSLLAELAAVASLVAETSPDASTHTLVQDCLALCRQPMALEQLINAIGDHVGAPSDTLMALFLASGLSGTVLAVTRMTDLPDGAFRDRLGELVARQELDIVRSALTRLRKDDHPVMIVLNVLRVLDPIRAPELCRLFIRDPDAGIRRLSLDMLREAPLSPLKRERVMIQAMGDHDADVALTALADLCANQTPSGLAALTKYLSRVDDRELEQLQIAAVDLLCDAWSGGASDVIATALRNRRHIFNGGPRRVSQVMVSALSAKPDLQGQAAARAWQRSAAGLWSTVLGGQKEAS